MSIGDDVAITIEDIDVVEQMQVDHGGWHDAMKECLIGPCKLLRLTTAEATVKAPSGNTYQLNSELLSKYAKPPGIDNPHGPRMSCLTSRDGSRKNVSSTNSVGTSVTLTSDVSLMKKLQNGHGGWSELMWPLLGQEVQVKQVFINGDLYVTWRGTSWRVNRHCIGKPILEQFQEGDQVLISNDIEATKKMQYCHGDWHEDMEAFAGQIGRVNDVLTSGDVMVQIGDDSICYNPLLLTSICSISNEIRSRDEEIKEMRLKIQRLEEEKLCVICRDNDINVTLGCGHRICDACANNLYECPMCRKKIDTKIRHF